MISWLKLDVNILDDSKIKRIRKLPGGDSLFVLWIGILCLAMKSVRPGVLMYTEEIPYDEELLADVLGLDVKTVRFGIRAFQKDGLLDGNLVVKFNEHQQLDKIERVRALAKERQLRFRERKQLPSGNALRSVTRSKPKDREENAEDSRDVISGCVENENPGNAVKGTEQPNQETRNAFVTQTSRSNNGTELELDTELERREEKMGLASDDAPTIEVVTGDVVTVEEQRWPYPLTAHLPSLSIMRLADDVRGEGRGFPHANFAKDIVIGKQLMAVIEGVGVTRAEFEMMVKYHASVVWSNGGGPRQTWLYFCSHADEYIGEIRRGRTVTPKEIQDERKVAEMVARRNSENGD